MQASSASADATIAANGQLRRSLGYWDLVAYGLAYIAPIAPLSVLGFVWVESKGLVALAFLIGAVCMYFTAKSYAMLTETVPSAGSVYGFARHALGTYPGFIAGWMILLDYLLIPAFLYVLIAVAMETLVPGIDRAVWIVALVAMTLGINWFGVTVTSRVNAIAVVIQIFIVVGLLVLLLMALGSGKGTGTLTMRPFYDSAAFSVAAVFSATSISITSFLGFDAISTLSEEVRDGSRRTVGRAIISVLVISAAFFVIVAWICGNVLVGVTIRDPATASYAMTEYAAGRWASITLAWCYAIIVGVSNALPMQVGVARVLFAMGRDRQLPFVLSRVHPRFGTPYVSMLVTTVLSLSVALIMRNRMDDLASFVNFGALSGFLLLHLSVISLYALRGRSRAWFSHWVVPVVGMAVVLAVFSGMSALAWKVGLVWLAVGLVYGAVLSKLRRAALNVPV